MICLKIHILKTKKYNSDSPVLDKLPASASFLTVNQKVKYIGLNIFHVLYPEKVIWQLILFQVQIHSIFPSAVDSGSGMSI